jgi:hypothetical protein
MKCYAINGVVTQIFISYLVSWKGREKEEEDKNEI